jgi:heme-degrading monooxygenase HmoA
MTHTFKNPFVREQIKKRANMYAVIFEVNPKAEGKDEYLKIASELRKFLENQEGFVSVERFQSLVDEGKILSLSFWEHENAVSEWRNTLEHCVGQRKGKSDLFHSYRIRVAKVVRDYTESDRTGAPTDLNEELS